MKTIKLFIATLTIAITSLVSYSQESSVSSFQEPSFDEISKYDGVTSIYLSKLMLNVANSMATDIDPRINSIVKDLNSIEIIVSKDKSSSLRIEEYVSEITKSLNLETLARVNDENEKINIYGLPDGNMITYLLMCVDDGNKYMILSMSGNIPIEKVAELAQ